MRSLRPLLLAVLVAAVACQFGCAQRREPEPVVLHIFLSDEAATEDVDAFQQLLIADPRVQKVVYSSTTESHREYQSWFTVTLSERAGEEDALALLEDVESYPQFESVVYRKSDGSWWRWPQY